MYRATALGFPIIAPDRPGYGGSTPFPPALATIASNAERLDDAIGRICETIEGRHSGVVLIGHSIGGAIALSIAARRPRWPLIGVAVSGVGLTPPPGSAAAWAGLPDAPMIEPPPALKDAVMFGPSWTLSADMPERSRLADAPAPRAEVFDMATDWPGRARVVAAQVAVPVHYRQGEFDRLWVANEDEVDAFGRAFTAAPSVDARLYPSAGHCIDFHRLGPALQLEQLAFALRRAVRRD
jgi:pimeloyl-ACP methyl ester carboxylesterase